MKNFFKKMIDTIGAAIFMVTIIAVFCAILVAITWPLWAGLGAMKYLFS